MCSAFVCVVRLCVCVVCVSVCVVRLCVCVCSAFVCSVSVCVCSVVCARVCVCGEAA